MKKTTILIADDHELVREGLVSILAASHPEWHVVADVASGKAAVELGIELRPDVAILDFSMPDITGLDVAAQLRRAVPGIRIVMLTMHAAAPILRHMRRAGVSAYVAKNEAPGTLARAVERVLAGEPFFASADSCRTVLDKPEHIPVQFVLTSREMDVLRLLSAGKSTKELAGDLDMSVRTAESHRANIMAKLNVESLAELIRLAVRDCVV